MTIRGRTSWRIAVVTVLLLAAMPALAGDREDISSPAGIVGSAAAMVGRSALATLRTTGF